MQASPQPQAPPIDVLILTYNGGSYLHPQLTSIAEQLEPGDRIIVSDDGSTDDTLRILQEFQQTYLKENVELLVYQGPGKGVIQNFFSGIQHTKAEYTFIADQDDVWLPGKRQLFAKQMQCSSKPHLIFSDAWLWNSLDTNTDTSFWQQQKINPSHARQLSTLIFRNTVQGASMAINRALIERISLHPDIVMHDWWCALHANAFGSISIIFEPTLLYRQHDANQIGALRKRTVREKRDASQKIFAQARAFRTILPQQHPSKAMLDSFNDACSKGLLRRALFLLQYRPKRVNVLKSITLWASILFNSKT
ncbi:glycosyltransferase family 2 protein [Reinekea blandensis]|uniref:Probable rhamnosyltransferase n=1 Tax=Reinekea blandensis MED297 TaxID=314283 RepID=A4BIZ2_9GAMM|nr:glycosyltransferase family 2 protein [Reinekea blandensis]EAR07925.1 probable rhamnosyltransferase [Reinekea sp. MED297] [Reinekea blandensis MED297]